MNDDRWPRDYSSLRDFYESTYDEAIVESRDLTTASASMLYCRQGAGDWSDAPTPDLVISLQRNTRSSGLVDLGAGVFRLAPMPNRGIVVPAHASTQVLVDQSHDILAIGLPFHALQQLLPGALPDDSDFGPLHAQEFNDPFVFAVLERLWQECEGGNPQGRLFAEGALVMLVATLLRLSERPVPKAVMKGGLAPWQVRRTTEVLRGELADNVSLNRLAGEVGLSAFHFARAFKQSTGLPPHRYRTRLRLEKACLLLETTDDAVTDIALQVGYESSQALARIFAKELGVTPSAWRRERRR